MGRARGPFIGRDRELKLVGDVLDDVSNSAAGFMVVSGEAGIGKSRLLVEMASIADASGWLALDARAAEFDSEVPFGVFADALDAYLGALEPDVIDRLATDLLGDLATVFPSLHHLGGAVEHPLSATERFRLHRAVGDLLERLAARQPMLLILDDIQWADGASLELITHLLRDPPEAEILLAMGLRSSFAEEKAALGIQRIRSAPGVADLELGPLSQEDVRVLVGGDADHLYFLSGGNPFYALQLARSGSVGLEFGTVDEMGVPAAVTHAISRELASFSEEARRLAEVAAVVGDPFDIDVVSAAYGMNESKMLENLDELVAKDLVRDTQLPQRFQFRHPIVRSAVYEGCSPSVRILTHRRAAAALARKGAPARERAFHVERSARHGDAEAISVLRTAGVEAAKTAPMSSLRWYEAALRLLPMETSKPERIEVLGLLSSSLAILGRFAEALNALREALEATGSVGASSVALIVRVAELERLLGEFDQSKTRLETAYEAMPDQLAPEAVSLAIALSQANFHLGDYPKCLEWGRLAATTAESSNDQTMKSAALASQAMGAAMAGEVVLARSIRDEAALSIDARADSDLIQRLDALSFLAASELYLDLYPEAAQHGERCMILARDSGQDQLLPVLGPIVGTSLWMIGELAKSAEVLDDAIEAARLIENVPTLTWQLFNRAYSAVMAGDLDVASKTSKESMDLASSLDEGIIKGYAGAIRAMVLAEQGLPEAARDQLLASTGGSDVPMIPGSWRPTFLELLTRCHLQMGSITDARKAAGKARREAKEYKMSLPLLMADRAEAAVALAEGRVEEAIALAFSAIGRSEGMGARVLTPGSRALAGRALAEAGRRDDAIEQLTKSASQFDAFGASRYRDQVESELRQLGVTVHRRSKPGRSNTLGVESLTGREREVAGLVVDRRTNREIAEMLFLSIKTVESHMRNIFNKLAVTSRVEVARVLTAEQSRPVAGV